MYRKRLWQTNLLDKATAEGSSIAYPIEDYEHMMLTVATEWNAEGSIRFWGSFADNAPDVTEDFSIDNQFFFISVRNIEDGTNVDWLTWITLEWTDVVNAYLVNVPWLKWIGATIQSYTAGTINVSLNGFSS